MNKPADLHSGKKRMMPWKLFTRAFADIQQNDPLRMAGATAFFTTFALPPILIILFQLFGLFIGKRLVGREMREIITETFGEDGARQLVQTIRGINNLASNWYITLGGFLFLIFIATTLFSVIKSSFNQIWSIGVKEKPGFLFNLKLRARSFAIILTAGILFVAGIVMDSFELLAGNYIRGIWSNMGVYFESILNEIAGLVIVTAWFIVLFRYLADGRPSWKVSIAGGCVTGVLFTAGKEILALLLRNSNINNIYGASGNIVLILLFVFYSSFILYYGACFIKVYADHLGESFRLINKAYRYNLQELNQ